LNFSLFYFGSDETQTAGDRYRLLIEGARFADAHGFKAVWTPERHFGGFGGLFPAPAVTSAVVAALTTHVDVRAGSVVLPLCDPLRVAEEWAVLDNITGGRVGLAIASGWQPSDFVFAPQNYERRRALVEDGIALLRTLWRGEPIRRTNGVGDEVDVRIAPRPLQASIPTWITSAGSPDTAATAGRLGCHLLTGLLSLNWDGVAANIDAYRSAWAGRDGAESRGCVTLMLHTFVGDTDQHARESVRPAMIRYLDDALHLIARPSGSTGHVPELDDLSSEDRAVMAGHAFERYYDGSALFGSQERCREIVLELEAMGVDEVACLIDFGLDTDTVLESLHKLARVKDGLAHRSR
jgi:natural product biosynthesis luciferase-like monooxygenase protein